MNNFFIVEEIDKCIISMDKAHEICKYREIITLKDQNIWIQYCVLKGKIIILEFISPKIGERII